MTLVLDLLAELEGAGLVAPSDRERRIRSLVQELDRIPAVIDSEARHAFAFGPSAAPRSDAVASEGTSRHGPGVP